MGSLDLGPLTPHFISDSHHPASQAIRLDKESSRMFGDHGLPPDQQGLNPQTSVPHKLANHLLGW